MRRLLLRHALSERDAEAASLVAQYMDDHLRLTRL
jgi:hypothetical protein